MKHFYLLLAALVCTPVLAQKPAQLPQCVLSPQHELEYRQHIEKNQHVAMRQSMAKNQHVAVSQSMANSMASEAKSMTRSSAQLMLCDYRDEYNKNGELVGKYVFTYDESGRRTSEENYNLVLADGVVWEGEATGSMYDAFHLRFSDNEGGLPSLSYNVYEKLVGKTLHLDIKNVVGDSTAFRIMNGWWSATYYEVVVHSGETLDFLFTQEMCDDCKDKNLTFMTTGTDVTISKLYFDVDKDAPAVPDTKTEYTYDAKGRQTSSVSYRQQNGELVYTSKSEVAYDANGYQIMSGDYYWENGAWVCRYKNEQLFDETGRQIGYINMSIYWKNTKNLYIFDDNGIMMGYLSYELQNDQWILTSKIVYSRTEDLTLTSSMEYLWQDSTWVVDVKNEYAFDENGFQTLGISYRWENNEWVGYSKSEYAYDENGNNTLSSYYTMVDGAWVGSYRYEYAYDKNGYQTHSVSYNWQDGAWVVLYRYEYAYDKNGYQTHYAYYNWQDGEWVGLYRNEYTYDENGNQTHYAYYNWQDGEWVVSSQNKYEYEYDNNGNIVNSISYYWYNGEWYNNGKTENTYDEYNNLTKEAIFTWNGEEWVTGTSYVYHYFTLVPKVTGSITPVVEEGSEITEQNAVDISEFKIDLNDVETFEVTENASAELLMDGVLTGIASKENFSEEDGVVTIKFKLLDKEGESRANFAALLSTQTRAASQDVKIEVKIASGSFSINEEVVTEEIAFSYTAPVTVVDAIEEALSIEGIAAEETAAPTYTLQGIRTSKAPKGLVIRNGQTFYVK